MLAYLIGLVLISQLVAQPGPVTNRITWGNKLSCTVLPDQCNWQTKSACKCDGSAEPPDCINECTSAPKYQQSRFVVALSGIIQWSGASTQNYMGSKGDGYIGKVDQPAARPVFTEVFGVANDRGLITVIEVRDDGEIYLKSWTQSLAFYYTDTSTEVSGYYYITDKHAPGQPSSCVNGTEGRSRSRVCPFGCTGTFTDGLWCPYTINTTTTNQQSSYEYSDISYVNLDGIVYVAQDPQLGSFGCGLSLPYSQQQSADYEQIIDFIKSPAGLFYIIVACLLNTSVIIIAGLFYLILISLRCIKKNIGDCCMHSRVKVLSYNDI